MTGFVCQGPHAVLGELGIIWTLGPKSRGNPELGGAGGGRGGQCILATPTPPAPDQSHPDWLYLCIKYYVDAVINRFDLTSEHNTLVFKSIISPLKYGAIKATGFYTMLLQSGCRMCTQLTPDTGAPYGEVWTKL